MIDFSREYTSPELAVSGNGGGRKNLKLVGGGEFDDLKDKLANLTKEEAEELLEYLKTKGIN